MTSPLRLVAPYVGTRYRLRGTEPDGWDCMGMVKWMRGRFADLDTPFGPDLYSAEQAKDPETVDRLLAAELPKWRQVRPQLWSVILFARPFHVGLMLVEGRFIHADVGINTVVERVSDWQHRIVGFHEVA